MNSQDKHDHSIDALRAMAEGEDLDPPVAAEASGDCEDAADASPLPLSDVPVGDGSPAARRARAASFNKKTRHAHFHQYKRTMIPLLLVVGVLLLIVGAVTLTLLPSGTATGTTEFDADNDLLDKYGRFLALASFPLAAILLLGAWLFHLDVTRSKKR